MVMDLAPTGPSAEFPSGRNLRIAFFAGTMRPGHDGVTRVLYRLIDYLREQNIDHSFFSPIVPTDGEYQSIMTRVPSVPFPLYKDYRVALPGQQYFEERLSAFAPDIIHINSPCSLGYAAVKYGRRHGIPVVATYHTHFISYARYYKVRALESMTWNYFRKLYNRCDRVLVPSVPVLNELSAHGLTTVEHLPHGVDANRFNPGFKSTEWKRRYGVDGRIALLFVGRLVWEKDLQTLASAYRVLTRRRNDLAFVLVGDGPIREELKRMMPGAKFLGHQSGLELTAAYASSDMLVFPSTTETFGNVIVEAMASGIPAVCANEGGASGVVQNGRTGLLAEPRDEHDLAEKIELLADDPTLRENLASNALSFARNQSWDKIFDRQMQIYSSILQNVSIQRLQHVKAA